MPDADREVVSEARSERLLGLGRSKPSFTLVVVAVLLIVLGNDAWWTLPLKILVIVAAAVSLILWSVKMIVEFRAGYRERR